MRKPKVLLLTAVFMFSLIIAAGCSVKVKSISLDQTQVTLAVGETVQLNATIEPEDASDKSVTWASDNEDVATVDQEGLVTAVAEGTAKITVTTKDGNFEASCNVTVYNPVQGVAIYADDEEVEELELVKGNTVELSAVVDPEIATNKNVEWEIVSGSDKISIEADGNKVTVTGVANGEAVLKVTTEDGEKTAQCAITVITELESVSINFNQQEVIAYDQTNNIITIEKGSTATLTPVFAPADATYKDVTWSSSASDKVSVNNGVITAVAVTDDSAEAIITVTSQKYSAISATIKVKVIVSAASVNVTVDGLNVTQYVTKIGDTVELIATVAPENATNKDVVWEVVSGGDKVSTAVEGNTFTVTANATGTVVVKATSVDGQAEKQITLTIQETIDVESISIGTGVLIIEKGEEMTLTPVFTPANTSYKTVTWSSSAPDYVSVDANGKITALKKTDQNVIITATSTQNPEVKATREVQVWVSVTNVIMTGQLIGEPIYSDDTIQLGVTVEPEDASNKNVIWESSDDTIATVDQNGLVTAKVGGEVTIKVKSAENGDIFDTWTFTVIDFNTKPADLNGVSGDLMQGFVSVNNPVNSLVKITAEDTGKLYYTTDPALNTRFAIITGGQSMDVEEGKEYIIMLNIANTQALSAKFVIVEDVNPDSITLDTLVSDIVEITWTADKFFVPDTSGGKIATWAALKDALLSGQNDITLACNIDAQGEPFSGNALFTKTFDGQNFYILNFNSTPTAAVRGGMFGNIGSPAVIKNFTFINPVINAGYNQTGLLAATNNEPASGEMRVENVHVVNLQATVTGNFNEIGVLFGRLKGAGTFDMTISNCSIEAVFTGGNERQGGLIGFTDYGANNKIRVENTKIDVVFRAGTGIRRGGVIGNYDGANGEIAVINSEILVKIVDHVSNANQFGGIAGGSNSIITISNSKVTLETQTDSSTRSGGVVGIASGNDGEIKIEYSSVLFLDNSPNGERKGGVVGSWEGSKPIKATNAYIFYNRINPSSGGGFYGGVAGAKEGNALGEFNFAFVRLYVDGTPGSTASYAGAFGSGATSNPVYASFYCSIVMGNRQTLHPMIGAVYGTGIGTYSYTSDIFQNIFDFTEVDDYVGTTYVDPAKNANGYMYWTYDTETNVLEFKFPTAE